MSTPTPLLRRAQVAEFTNQDNCINLGQDRQHPYPWMLATPAKPAVALAKADKIGNEILRLKTNKTLSAFADFEGSSFQQRP
ncbi:hypothetical protein QQ020_35185 [Fulvivirgaceae bacterium BMA12]|uniref:Uncharacterized protein n=1 Tax=Agaribacillus aureus TaxID=3051825 RepID=A0ABT8LHW6_9BACT|nr:hypothetical protein [Fulvivirgaceae bacterium BMA12]